VNERDLRIQAGTGVLMKPKDEDRVVTVCQTGQEGAIRRNIRLLMEAYSGNES